MCKKLTILITGVNGQIGFELSQTLRGLGNIIPINRSVLDLSDLNRARKVVRELRPSIIVNSAAYTAVDKAETDVQNAYRLNADVPRILAEEAVSLKAALIHYSTDYVFDGMKKDLYVETDQTNPKNIYGLTKLEGENAIIESGCSYIIFRTSWVYGLRRRNFLSRILKLGSNMSELYVVLNQKGIPTWARTIAAATSKIIEQAIDSEDIIDWWSKFSGIYHLTSSGSTSWHGFAEAIFDFITENHVLKIVPILISDYPAQAFRPENSCLAIDKLVNTFNLQMPYWKDSLQLCLNSRNKYE
ncbi:MAG: dTDP-4-dehydrorhamnose reductase [Burkholderia sp.]|nr:dTDP-4-dehydrorhamnose reductase [Burkholderia sp.]